MANDKGDGEDLFEDLDKFFAPIRDVDWDEPEEPTERAPQESHVEVRSVASSGSSQSTSRIGAKNLSRSSKRSSPSPLSLAT